MQTKTVTEGKSVSLYCSAIGFPKPEYQWMFENETVSLLSVLTICNVSRGDEGVYSCLVHSYLGDVILIVDLNVLGK